ncbi:hypothetical protein CKF54_00930 [Psittacicella hinzii]|uniref:D12 class N6 adenine-specific DNA methyltransferase n=1 Tax=Psittacicella hinzii TaxID=2028575 RepID=A0A3A1YDX9_9GAMM|nr:hypothetical protein CKF54_00930 [Psittacicella hinzii]
MPQKQIELCEDYLDGIEVVHCDYKELLTAKEYQHDKVVFLLDPPYIGTNLEGYSEEGETFNYADLLELMLLIRPPYLFFYINNRFLQIEDLFKKMVKHDLNAKAFSDVQMVDKCVTMSPNARRKETIYYHL